MHKNFQAKTWDNVALSYKNCSPHVLPLPCNVSQRDVTETSCLLVVNMVFTKEDKVAIKFLHKTNIMVLSISKKNFMQSNGSLVDWTEFWRKSTREVLLNERKVLVGWGRCVATTTSNTLSSCEHVKVKGGHFEHKLSSFRLLLVGSSYLFYWMISTSTSMYCWLSLLSLW